MDAEHEVMPLDTLPDDVISAKLESGMPRYTFASDVFDDTGLWIIADNDGLPTKVWRIPRLISSIMDDLFEKRFEMGQSDARNKVRQALGL